MTLALQDFLNLEDRSTPAAITYLQNYGEFDLADISDDALNTANAPAEIREFCKKAQSGKELVDPFILPLLATALEKEDIGSVKLECRRRRPNSTFMGQPDWFGVGRAILCADVSASLNSGGSPRILLGERDREFCSLTVCSAVRTALYVLVLKMVVSGTEYQKCANCRKHFVVTVKGKRFCSAPCQNAAKVRAWRERREETPSVQPRRNRKDITSSRQSYHDEKLAPCRCVNTDTALTKSPTTEATMAKIQRITTHSFSQESPSSIVRVAVYARVSTLNGQDFEMQLRELREYASRRGWLVDKEYIDRGVSG